MLIQGHTEGLIQSRMSFFCQLNQISSVYLFDEERRVTILSKVLGYMEFYSG